MFTITIPYADDADWVRLLKQGDEQACTILWELLCATSQRRGQEMGLDPQMMHHAAAEAYDRILFKHGIDRLRMVQSFRYFCLRTVTNELYRIFSPKEYANIDDLEETQTAAGEDPALAVADLANCAPLRGCYEKLQERLQRTCTLYYFEDRSNAEIAEALGVTANHVAQLVHRARAALKKCLESNGFHSAADVL